MIFDYLPFLEVYCKQNNYEISWFTKLVRSFSKDTCYFLDHSVCKKYGDGLKNDLNDLPNMVLEVTINGEIIENEFTKDFVLKNRSNHEEK